MQLVPPKGASHCNGVRQLYKEIIMLRQLFDRIRYGKTIVHCNRKHNAELIAKILDADDANEDYNEI